MHFPIRIHTQGEQKDVTLRELKEGQAATVTRVGGQGSLRQHFLDMGLIPGVEVRLVKFAPDRD